MCGEFTETDEFRAQSASYAENVSISWRHHELFRDKYFDDMYPRETGSLRPQVIRSHGNYYVR